MMIRFKSVALLLTCIMVMQAWSAYGAGNSVNPGAGPDVMGTESTTVARNTYHNPVHMVAVFTRFLGEDPGMTEPPEWTAKMFNGQPGSVNHYFDTMTFGQIKVTGEVLPIVIELPHKASYYGTGSYGVEYTYDTLVALDEIQEISFTDYDNDGPDGIPGSSDDDGYVDYIVLMPLSQPSDFLTESVIGIAALPITTYTSDDIDSQSRLTRVDGSSGCIANGSFEDGSIGLLAHEFIHSFGLLDLYDTKYTNTEDESGGIGFWGIMGTGTLGWNWHGGPVGMSAYTRFQLGAIGINNANLKDLYGNHENIRISDVSNPDGCVYRIWISNSEYFLIEHRRNDGNYYDRDAPASGLLIWHVYRKSYLTNNNEELKLCDLECADGRYTDAGYPLGLIPDPEYGRDNLDFYSKSTNYATSHAGNLGDATDVFDGVKYTSFDPNSNPNTNSKVDHFRSNLYITNIRQNGDDMLFDVRNDDTLFLRYSWMPHIGIGFNGLNIDELKISMLQAIEQDTYVVSRIVAGKLGDPEQLISVGADNITTIDLSGANEGEVQSLIAYYTLGIKENISGAVLERINISRTEFENELAQRGITGTGISDNGNVVIQKISVTVNTSSHPAEIQLKQNYPNPFNAQTTIVYSLPSPQSVKLEIFNIVGQCIGSYEQGFRHAGTHTATFAADGLASGIYMYRISGETISQTKRFVYMR